MAEAATVLKRLGAGALHLGPVGRAARSIGAARGRALVLVYHRVTPEDPGPAAVVPWVQEALFRRHVQALGELGELVPLEELLLEPGGRRRVRFALTFDDDYQSHADQVLPVLGSLGVRGTFFLSGRSLHGLGPYWFETLERLLQHRPLDQVARMLGMAGGTAEQLALACEQDLGRQHRLEQIADGPAAHLAAEQITTLAAGSTVGFHTLHHRVLTSLPDEALERELTEGREALAAAAGQPLPLFAYPHGKGDGTVAARARAAGYAAAWTGVPNAIRTGADPFLLGRWEPGALSVDELVVKVAIRLNRTLPAVPT
jgi:peptidoglycan/xylan/chitin deacetylase (PgdA/CDA1 family)